MPHHAGRALRASLAELPAALVVGLTVSTVAVLTIGSVLGHPLHARGVTVAVLAVGVSTTGAVTWWLTDRTPVGVTGWLGLVPATWVAGAGVVSALLGGVSRVEWFMGGDNVRHMAFVAEIVDSGSLDYSINVYPRAWHQAVAVAWLAWGHDVPGDASSSTLTSFITVNAAATWVLFSVLVLATSNLAAAVARVAAPGSDRTPQLAALVAGFLVMTPRFMADTMALGFQTSLVAATALAVVARECLLRRRRGPLRGYVVVLAAVVLMCHTWQMLVPSLAVAAALLGLRTLQAGRRAALGVLAMTAAGVAASVPPVVAVGNGPGVSTAAVGGVIASPSWWTLVAGAAAVAVVLRRLPRAAAWSLACTAYAPIAVAVAIALTFRVPLTAYYPAKLLWHVGALGLAFVAPLVVLAVVTAPRKRLPVRLGGAALGLSTACLVAWGALTPVVGSQIGAWSTVDGELVVTGVADGVRRGADVVWLGTETESAVTRTLLGVARGEVVYDDRPSLSDECRVLRSSPAPTVVTTRAEASARRRYDCVETLSVIVVPTR